jgi:hypothetical protein
MDLAALCYSPHTQINSGHVAAGVPSAMLFMATIIPILVALYRATALDHL